MQEANAQTAITTAETAVTNNALVPVLIGLAWLADKAWTAYEVSQDVAAIRDGTRDRAGGGAGQGRGIRYRNHHWQYRAIWGQGS